jgi:hypothetical protein
VRVLGRGIFVIASLHAAAAVAVWQLASTVRVSTELAFSQGTDPARALVAWVVLLCSALVAAVWLWLVCSTVATTLAVLRAAPSLSGWLLAPPVLRVALGLVVGTTVSTLVAGPSTSAAARLDGNQRQGPNLPGALEGLRVPDRVVGGPPRRGPDRRLPGNHVRRVRPGDSLWSITAALLRTPVAARIARSWPRLYAANHDVVGPDPDLIRPGMRLVVPLSLHRPDRGGPR